MDALIEISGTMKVLYVEDDEIIAAAVRHMLLRTFERVDLAEDGEEGLKLYQEDDYDIVISDIRMPRMDGITMCKKIREINPEQKVVITSASNDSDYLMLLIELGIDKFILKPISREQLFGIITTVVKSINDRRLLETYRNELEEINAYSEKEQFKGHRKQISIIVNDLEDDPAYETRIFYKASDILSGDSYSVFKKPDGSILIYLLDAMGHGISPSLTSFSVASAVKSIVHENASFETIIENLLKIFHSTLLYDEQLSCIFVEIDPTCKQLRYFSGGMYPVYVEDGDELITLKSNNPPFMNYEDSIREETIPLKDFRGIFMYTDGLSEFDNKLVQQDEIKKLLNPSILHQRFEELSDMESKDDITIVRIWKS